MALNRPRPSWTSAAAKRIVAAAGGERTVEQAIVEIVTQLTLGLGGPPTDLEAVARLLRVTSIRAEALPVSGELRHENGELSIVYASGLSAGRRRFTVAHELGHAFFERTGPNCPRRGQELERICDLFAVELLMPASAAKALVVDEDPAYVIEMARRFDVSVTAAMYRCAEVSGIHAALDTGRSRSVTCAALSPGDPQLDELVALARTSKHASAVMRLVRNRVWNGPWKVSAADIDAGRLVVLTALPVPHADTRNTKTRANTNHDRP